jgi:type II secretory pathway pseudopilin PulG
VIRLYVLIVVVGLVGGAIAGGYYYYTDSQARIQALIENTAKLQMAKQVQDDTISVLVEDQKKFAKLNSDLRANLDKANDYKDVLIGKLRKHNLSNLSLRKPLLVEKRINAATAKLFKSLEVMSGAAPASK